MPEHVSESSIVPVARTEDLIVTPFGDDLTVYDQATHTVHHLNGPVAAAWQLCDGKRSIGDLMYTLSVDRDMAVQALVQLEQASLLVGSMEFAGSAGETRRGLVRKAAIAAIGTPMIVSVTAPSAAASTSPGGPKGPGDPKAPKGD